MDRPYLSISFKILVPSVKTKQKKLDKWPSCRIPFLKGLFVSGCICAVMMSINAFQK